MGLQASTQMTTRRILVVEDDQGARDLIVSSLRADGHEADSGELTVGRRRCRVTRRLGGGVGRRSFRLVGRAGVRSPWLRVARRAAAQR